MNTEPEIISSNVLINDKEEGFLFNICDVWYYGGY